MTTAKTALYTPPAIPSDEAARLEELYSLKILDTAAEERFDRYTGLASEIFNVPIALISLIDKDRQWFKSAHGLGVRELPREISFCGHAILGEDVFVVSDATKDTRFADNPLVAGDPGIRFYAGAVVRGPFGRKLGTCCIIDRTPRVIEKNEKRILWHLGQLVAREIQVAFDLEKLRRQLQDVALYDPSTRLPNRRLFTERLEDSLKNASVTGKRRLLVFIRLGRHDQLHDALGSLRVNSIVHELGARIVQASGLDAITGSWEEDTLVALMPLDDGGSSEVDHIEKILACLRRPVSQGGSLIPVGASLGANIYPDNADSAQALIEGGLAALRANPPHEGLRYELFKSALKTEIARRFQIEDGLRAAIAGDELSLVFQPKVSLVDGRVCGAEALVRWTSPSLGNVSPGEFIPIAEQAGLTIALGAWVLKAACRQGVRWEGSGMSPLPISVNVTSLQLRQADFVDVVVELLADTGLRPSLLKLEVTEGSLIEDIEGAIKAMNSLKKVGVSFSIDDYGTGFSSLAYLSRMPVDELKIDRSFVDRVAETQADARIVQGTIMMAHGLGLKVVAEGVETEEQLTFLRAYQCDEIQGYLFSKPLAADKFAELVQQDRRLKV